MIDKIKGLCKSRLVQNGFWLVILQGFNTVVPVLTIPYITRILSASAYGAFSWALNIVGYFQVIVEYGFGLSGARKIAMRKHDTEIAEIRTKILIARLVLTCICLLLLTGVMLISSFDKTQMICMLILFSVVIATAFQQTFVFQGLANMKPMTVITVVSRTISVILIFAFVKKTDDLYLYCLLYASTSVITGLISCIILSKKYRIKFKFNRYFNIKDEMHEGWPLFVSSAISKVFGNIGVTVLGFFATKEIVGIYSAINKIPYVMTLIFLALSQALYPHICKAFSESDINGWNCVKRYSKPIITLFGMLGAVLIVLNKPVVYVAFGPQYVKKSLLLVPFIIWTVFAMLNNFLGIQALVASGHQKEYSRCLSFSVICMAVLMTVLGYFFEEYGIAFASMFSEIILTVFLTFEIRKNITKKSY